MPTTYKGRAKTGQVFTQNRPQFRGRVRGGTPRLTGQSGKAQRGIEKGKRSAQRAHASARKYTR